MSQVATSHNPGLTDVQIDHNLDPMADSFVDTLLGMHPRGCSGYARPSCHFARARSYARHTAN
jgi:hypothetical protein